MSRASFVLFAIFVAMCITRGSSNGNRTCSSNEVWNSCGSACAPSCENPEPTFCTANCIIGCQCKDNLLRNKEGKCVPKSEC
ncbi:chymotrypsin inhibitor-like [Nomia melanderi]|uniref:chymotrypsin inhibitor-like n=1 Tax=Nomia melanderi TaxID=2448451 RepID=UPI0013044E19|nr:chymotrypsin inhibitor-like [Nomia melanderi]